MPPIVGPIGKKRHRLTVQKDYPSRGPDGGPVSNWVTLATVWAAGGPDTARELWQARQAQSDVTHVWKIRWSSTLEDLSGSIRVLFNSERVFHVKTARNTDERRREWVLECSEAPDQSRILQDETGAPLLDETGDLVLEP